MSRSTILTLIVFVTLALVGGGMLVTQKQPDITSNEEVRRIRVAATIYPLYDLVRTVAGDRADVVLMVPPGALEHHFELTPKIISSMMGVQTIFAIGHGLDAWALNVKNTLPDASVVVVDRNIAIRESTEQDGGPTDPHYWLHVGNARMMADTIADALSEMDPDSRSAYHANAERLKADLVREEKALKVQIEPYRGASIIVFHDAWFYFAENMGLTIAGAFEPFVAEEPTARHLAELTQIVKEKKITTIFIEPQLSSAAIESFAEDNNLGIATLDPLGGIEGRMTYLELMRYNGEQIVRALNARNQ